MRKKVAVVILNWNGKIHGLKFCIQIFEWRIVGIKPTVTISKTGDTWKIATDMKLRTVEIIATEGVEFDEGKLTL